MRRDKAMRYLKAACGLLCFLVLASNVWSMSRWSETRGVYDDICYLIYSSDSGSTASTPISPGMTIITWRRN
jgi:hypothetical protein